MVVSALTYRVSRTMQLRTNDSNLTVATFASALSSAPSSAFSSALSSALSLSVISFAATAVSASLARASAAATADNAEASTVPSLVVSVWWSSLAMVVVVSGGEPSKSHG